MAVDMFLKLDGIKGESKDKAHPDEIQIESFSWGMTQGGSFGFGGGGGTGKVNVADISVTKFVDKASPDLMLACTSGKHIKDGLITVRKAGQNAVEYLKIKLTDILVTSIQHGGGHGDDLITENVALNYAKFNVDYQEQDKNGKAAGGPVKMGWDIKANVKA